MCYKNYIHVNRYIILYNSLSRGGDRAHDRAFCVSITHPPIQKN